MSETLTHRIIAADGTIICESELKGGRFDSLIPKFVQRCKNAGGKAIWGQHYRALKRRSDPPSLVLKCKRTGEELHSYPTKTLKEL